MARLDTATLALSGEAVAFEDFAKAIAKFYDLISSLSSEAGGDVSWVVYDLQRSSAVATIKGLGAPERIERVVKAYLDVGNAIAQRAPIPFSPKVQNAAKGLTAILKHNVDAIRFENAERDVTITRGMERNLSFKGHLEAKFIPVAPQTPLSAFGSVEGRIQTLTNRGGLRFTLYDTLHDKAVSCYLKEGFEIVMRDAWGKLAAVAGLVSRDPGNGRPLTIRQVSDVSIRPEVSGSFRDARGCSPPLTNMSPEEAIRKLRDA